MSIRDTSAQDIKIAPGRSRKQWVKWAVIGLVAILATVYLASSLQRWFSSDLTVSSDRLRTANVVRGSFVSDVGVQGRVVAAISPTLYSTATGTVSLDVQPGDQVVVDQVLAVITSLDIEAELAQETAETESIASELERRKIEAKQAQVTSQQVIDLAEVTLNAAKREMRRAELSKDINAISDIDYQRYRDELATAEVQYEHAIQDASLEKDSLEFEIKTQQLALERQTLVLENLQRRVDELTVRSPVNGIVGNVVVNQREVVAANQALITVVDLSAFEVEVRIPETYADDMGIGMPGELQVNGVSHPGVLVSLSPEVTNNEVVGRIRFDGDSPAGLRQNQRVNARIVIDQLDNVLKLRRGSFTDSGGGRVAFVVNGDGLAEKRAIRIGARSVSEIEIVSGLEEGDEVIISSIAEYQEQDVIRIVN